MNDSAHFERRTLPAADPSAHQIDKNTSRGLLHLKVRPFLKNMQTPATCVHPAGVELFVYDSSGIEAEKRAKERLTRWRSLANSHFQVDGAGIFHRLRINWSPFRPRPAPSLGASWGYAAGDEAPDPTPWQWQRSSTANRIAQRWAFNSSSIPLNSKSPASPLRRDGIRRRIKLLR